MSKKSILVLCGGQSTEHNISILSARNVVKQLDADQYQVSVAYILRDGRWFYFDEASAFISQDLALVELSPLCAQLMVVPGSQQPFVRMDQAAMPSVDCVMPILHGANGEDGVMQGFLEVLNLPYVGADVLGAAVAIHKDVTKKLLRAAQLPVVDDLVVTKESRISYADAVEHLGSPFFVKANSLGSSIGVYRVADESAYESAIAEAFQYDHRILLERAIVGREIECSVLGNDKPVASLPGEIINHTAFYSYAAKYLEENAATVQTPADLEDDLIERIRQLAVKAVKAIYCEGMARVDFFVTDDQKIFINEVNTIPGFTDISMYPKNWEASGLTQAALFDKLIQLAIVRFENMQRLTRDQLKIAAA